MGEAVQDILDDDFIEQDFNDSLEYLQKSLKSETESELRRTGEEDEHRPLKKKKKVKKAEEMPESDEEESEEDEEVEYEKSLTDFLAEDPEAAVSMDVEPFLRQLAKSLDESLAASIHSILNRLDVVEGLVKSQAQVLLHTAKLEKSISDTINKIGEQPIRSNSQKILRKSRFGGEESVEYDNREVLQKSREWALSKKINLVEAGMIEGRINKGLLGTVNDQLDQKVAHLMKEGN